MKSNWKRKTAALVCAALAWGAGMTAGAQVIHVTGDTTETEINGGYSLHGDVTDNEVHVEDGARVDAVTGGRSVFEGAARDNLVSIRGTVRGASETSAGSIYGGRSGSGPVSGNDVRLSGADVSGWRINELVGGEGDAGTVAGNTVTIDRTMGLALKGGLAGGRASYGAVSGNTLTITDSTVTAEGGLYGGLIIYGPGLAARDNAVTIEGKDASVIGDVYGGYNPYGDAAGNRVEIDGGTVNADSVHAVYGGAGSGVVSGNTVIVSGGAVGGPIYGGQGSGTVSNNTVTLSGGTVNHAVYGGQGDGMVSGNTVALTGSVLAQGVAIYGGQGNGTVEGNRVLVDDADGTVGNTLYGGAGSGLVKGNEVELRSGTLSGTVYGGQSGSRAVYNAVRVTGGTVEANASLYGGSGTGTIAGNTVDITGGSVAGRVYGASGTGSVVSNVVTVNGGTLEKGSIIYGGYGSGTVAANVVVLANGTVTGDVYAGASSDKNGSRDVKYNLMTLSGGVDVSKADLYGYNGNVSGGGNTLVVDHTWENVSEKGHNFVQSVRNFDALVLQDVKWAPEGSTDTPVISIGAGDLTHTTVRLVLSPDSPLPTADGHMDLIHVEHNLNGGDGASEVDDLEHRYEGKGVLYSRGVAVIGRLPVYEDGGAADFQVGSGTAERNPQTDVVADSRLVSLAFLNQGADLASDSLDLLDSRYGWGLRTFGLVYGSDSRYDAAGGFRIRGWNGVAGVGGVHPERRGELAWGLFYENGTGRYDADNSFLGVNFTGRGSLHYHGGGAAVRYTAESGAYCEASFRAGTLDSAMTDAVMDGKQDFYGFDSRSSYWGAHAGAGWKTRRGEGEWDLYGKYFHTEVDGGSLSIGGDRFEFSGMTSDRLRLGARYTARAEGAWSPYAGLAWEYEFDGAGAMRAGGFEAPEESLRGGTVIGEAGVTWRPSDSRWRASFLLRGYAGERDGVSGTAQISYSF